MKDVLNGITTFNPLGGEQSLVLILTDLIVNRNTDEIDEIDNKIHGVRITQDKSDPSLSD